MVGNDEQLEWLLRGAGVGSLETAGWIRVTGGDRVRWLNGMVTNSIQELKPGGGNYSFALNAQGRLQGDLWTYADEDALLLETDRERVPALMAWFDRYIIMDDVELADVSGDRAGVSVTGPAAMDLLKAAGLAPGNAVRTKVERQGAVVEVIRERGEMVPRFAVWTDPVTLGEVREELVSYATEMEGGWAGPEAMEWLRVLEGRPRFGVDLRDKDLPQETEQAHALHFAKGCYLGQEIVERIRSRGSVHRGFGAFRLEGPLPVPGSSLTAEDGKTVGELTSIAAIPLASGTVQYGLGIARREAVERGGTIRYAAEQGTGVAVRVSVPIRP